MSLTGTRLKRIITQQNNYASTEVIIKTKESVLRHFERMTDSFFWALWFQKFAAFLVCLKQNVALKSLLSLIIAIK